MYSTAKIEIVRTLNNILQMIREDVDRQSDREKALQSRFLDLRLKLEVLQANDEDDA